MYKRQGYTSILATIAATHAASTDARAAAVILLKNMVRVRWKSRGARNVIVGDGEKAALRGALLGAAMMEEPQARVASQVRVGLGILWVLVCFLGLGWVSGKKTITAYLTQAVC